MENGVIQSQGGNAVWMRRLAGWGGRGERGPSTTPVMIVGVVETHLVEGRMCRKLCALRIHDTTMITCGLTRAPPLAPPPTEPGVPFRLPIPSTPFNALESPLSQAGRPHDPYVKDPGVCYDESPNCPEWAARGDCEKVRAGAVTESGLLCIRGCRSVGLLPYLLLQLPLLSKAHQDYGTLVNVTNASYSNTNTRTHILFQRTPTPTELRLHGGQRRVAGRVPQVLRRLHGVRQGGWVLVGGRQGARCTSAVKAAHRRPATSMHYTTDAECTDG